MSELFNHCYRCKSIIWGYTYTNNQGQDFCSDCAKCSTCHLKLTTPYWNKNNGEFFCKDCKIKLDQTQQDQLQENLAKLQRDKENLQKKLDELNNPPSRCEKCYKKIKGGDTYYATDRHPEKKTCVACYKKKIDQESQKIEEEERMIKEAEKINKSGKLITLSSDQRTELSPEGLEYVEAMNRELEAKLGSKQDNKNNSSSQDENYALYGFLVIIGIIILCGYFYSVGKNNQQKI